MRSRALTLAALALLVSLCGWTSAGVRPAAAQALDAGKPPAQIFNGTCSACHRSPRGLVRNVSPGSLPGFLRQHYTTGNDMAGTMATYVLGNGGTDRVAEPSPKREPKQEPKQRAKSDAPEVAARTQDAKDLKEQSKAAKQQKGKKGSEPAGAAKDTPGVVDPGKAETARTEPVVDPAKAETAATDCKVEEPVRQATAPAGDDKPRLAMPTPASTPPRQPTSLLTLPGFPAPIPEPEPEPEPEPVAATATPGCDPPKEAARDEPKEVPKVAAVEPSPPAAAPAPATAQAAKPEPLRPAVAEASPPGLDIMQEEVHAPRPARAPQQKKRVP